MNIDQFQEQIALQKRRILLDKYLQNKYMVRQKGVYKLDPQIISQEQLTILKEKMINLPEPITQSKLDVLFPKHTRNVYQKN
jgi:hypothetical protein